MKYNVAIAIFSLSIGIYIGILWHSLMIQPDDDQDPVSVQTVNNVDTDQCKAWCYKTR